MATIAIRVPTLTAAGESLPSGHTYLMLPPLTSVLNLIDAKVAAEFRKLRAAGPQQSSIGALLPDGVVAGHGPLDEQLVTAVVLRQFVAGAFTVLVDDQLVTDLDALIAITRRTSIAFIVAAPVLA
jgi:hypothetical protein